jgi:hypothetical protein
MTNIDMTEDESALRVEDDTAGIQKLDGRSRAARAMRSRPQSREAARSGSRSGEVLGRNGEVLSRKRTLSGDIFAIPAELIPAGWEYQWAAVSIVGNTEILMDQNLMFAENGWRPVPADRYPGRFMPAGAKGNITRGGQMLMERPSQLCDEARAEDNRNARQLISDRNASLKLSTVKTDMAPGFEVGKRYRGTGGDIRMSIDPALDVAQPTYELAEDQS